MTEPDNTLQTEKKPSQWRLWAAIGAAILSTAGIFCAGWFGGSKNWIEAAGLAGSWASIIGIIITLWQLGKVRSTTEAISNAVDHSSRLIYSVNSIQDISESYRSAAEIHTYIQNRKLDCAWLRMHDLLKPLNALQIHQGLYPEFEREWRTQCRTLKDDINDLTRNLRSESLIDLQQIENHLIDLSSFLTNIITHLKIATHDRS